MDFRGLLKDIDCEWKPMEDIFILDEEFGDPWFYFAAPKMSLKLIETGTLNQLADQLRTYQGKTPLFYGEIIEEDAWYDFDLMLDFRNEKKTKCSLYFETIGAEIASISTIDIDDKTSLKILSVIDRQCMEIWEKTLEDIKEECKRECKEDLEWKETSSNK